MLLSPLEPSLQVQISLVFSSPNHLGQGSTALAKHPQGALDPSQQSSYLEILAQQYEWKWKSQAHNFAFALAEFPEVLHAIFI